LESRREEGRNRKLEKTAQWAASSFIIIKNYNYDEQTQEEEMGRACRALGRDYVFIQDFSRKYYGRS
jgi:hypothetical protein